MKFLNEFVRKEFHKLTLDRQRAFIDADERLNSVDSEITILFVDIIDDKESEIAVRIDYSGIRV